MDPLRIGVLGAARISEKAIVAPARDVGARLVAVAARDRGRAETFARTHGVERVLDSYADVVADPEVEAVYNPLANGLHAPWNLAAVAAGKHVLSEKPFASDAEEAEEVRDAAAAAGVRVADGFHYVFHPVTRRLDELLASGELGDLHTVQATMVVPAPGDDDLRWSLPLAGGALMDLGCYSLHAHRVLARFAGGAPTVTAARATEREGLPGVDQAMAVDLLFPSGATGSATCDMASDDVRMTLRVEGTLGEAVAHNFVLPQRDDRLTVRTAEGERVENLGTRPSYSYQLEAFTAFVREGRPMATDADDAVATMRLVDDSYTAAGLPLRPRSPRVG